MKSRIVILTNDPWGKYSGWKAQTKNLIEFLKEKHDFIIYTFGDINDEQDWDKDYEITHVLKNQSSRISKLFVLFLYSSIVIKQRKLIDVIYLPKSHLTVLPVSILGSLLGIKVVTRISGGELDDYGFKQKVKNYFLKRSHKCIALNQSDYDRLKKLSVKAVYIPNAINLDRFQPNAFKVSSGLFQLCTFGSVCFRKRTDLAIKIFRALIDHGIKAKLTIIGPVSGFGEYNPDYVRKVYDLIETLNLQDDVSFTEEVNNPQDFLQKSDVILFPSLSEGMPNALIEAMACGCVPVANSIPGVSELIEDGYNGFLIDNNDFKSYQSTCLKLYSNKNLLDEIKSNTVEYVKRNFNASEVYRSYDKIFDNDEG